MYINSGNVLLVVYLYTPQASDSTQFEWCPDGVHVVTATTAPRLREGNG